jgi:hypothetical protein
MQVSLNVLPILVRARWQPAFAGSPITTHGGQAEVCGSASAGFPVDLGEFFFDSGEADGEAFDFAEPAFAFGFGDAGGQVVADLGEPSALGGVGPEHGAADAGVFVNAGVPNARPQVPVETLRRSKWLRNSCHS